MGPIRQRKALSCVDCRRRKVKCDRAYPICKRCEKSGNADKCTYVSVVGGPDDAIPTPSDDSPDQQREDQSEDIDALIAPWQRQDGFQKLKAQPPPLASDETAKRTRSEKDLLARVVELETYMRSAGERPIPADMKFGIANPRGPGNHFDRNPVADYDRIMVRGKAFSTQYFGPSFPISLLLQFDDLSKFVKDVLTMVPDLSVAKKEMAFVRDASRRIPRPQVSSDLRHLLKMVPAKELSDKCVEHYMATFETTYRILHVPSFLRAYEDFWKSPRQSDPDFVVQLLLVIASVYCVVPGGPSGFIGRSSARREVAILWVAACETWVGEQSKKHMTMSHLQAHVLIFLARQMNCIKVKREWINSGTLVRLAMGAGMHREPSFLSRKISAFECEMRRRLWFTIIELDLQTTISRGMAPSLDTFGWDCLPPRNIHDEDFDEESQSIPPSYPLTQFTRTAFLHCINGFLGLRIEILGRMNSIRLGVDLETVMQYDNRLRKQLDELPIWDKNIYPLPPMSRSPTRDSKDDDTLFPPRAPTLATTSTLLMRLILYEFILVLHVPFAGSTPNQSRFIYTVSSKRDAAIKCLHIYYTFQPQMRLHLSNLREDLCRASLSMCHDLVTNRAEDPISNIPLAYELILCVANTLSDRVQTLGQGFHGYWITITGHALVRWKMSGQESAEEFAKECAGQVIKLFQDNLLSNQVGFPNLDGSLSLSTTKIGIQSQLAPSSSEGVGGSRRDDHVSGINSAPTPTNNNNINNATALTPGAASVAGKTRPQSSIGDNNNDVFPGFDNSISTSTPAVNDDDDNATFVDPMWDFMNFDFGSVWNLGFDGYPAAEF